MRTIWWVHTSNVCMDSTRRDHSVNAGLWRDYRCAFKEFAQSVQRVQTLTAQPDTDRAALDKALLEMEKARLNYNRSRDALAERLLRPEREALPALAPDSPEAYADRVRVVAHLLWEGSGKPDGTAESDWQRAEQIVRGAAAA